MTKRNYALLIGALSVLALFGVLFVVGLPVTANSSTPRPAVTVPSEWVVPPSNEPAQPINVVPDDSDDLQPDDAGGSQSDTAASPGRRPGRPGGQRQVDPPPARPAPGRPTRPNRR